jgi:hypothetical protein
MLVMASSMSRTVSAGSNLCRITTAEPLTIGMNVNAHWAEWYTGPTSSERPAWGT